MSCLRSVPRVAGPKVQRRQHHVGTGKLFFRQALRTYVKAADGGVAIRNTIECVSETRFRH